MPSISEGDLIIRYGVINAMYPLSGMIFAPLFGYLEIAGKRNPNEKKRRRKDIVRKIGFASTFAFFVGNILYATASFISCNEEVRFSIILMSRVIAGIASGSYLGILQYGFFNYKRLNPSKGGIMTYF